MKIDYIEESSEDQEMYISNPAGFRQRDTTQVVAQSVNAIHPGDTHSRNSNQARQTGHTIHSPFQQQMPINTQAQSMSSRGTNVNNSKHENDNSQNFQQNAIQRNQSQNMDVEILERKLNEIELLIQEKSLIVQQIEQLKIQLSLVDKRIETLESEVMEVAELSHVPFAEDTSDSSTNRGPLFGYNQSTQENESKSVKPIRVQNTTHNQPPTKQEPQPDQKKRLRMNNTHISQDRDIPIRTTSRSPSRSKTLIRSNSMKSDSTGKILTPSRLQTPIRAATPPRTSSPSRTPNKRSLTPTRSNSFSSRTPVISKMPERSTPKSSSKKNIFDRLTDPALYTGTHKERFDAFGRGRGLAGRRDYFDNGIPYDEVFPKTSPGVPTPKTREVADDPAARVMLQSILKIDPDSQRQSTDIPLSRQASKEDIFEHLTNPSTYTGMYKVRAEEGEKLHKQLHRHSSGNPFLP